MLGTTSGSQSGPGGSSAPAGGRFNGGSGTSSIRSTPTVRWEFQGALLCGMTSIVNLAGFNRPARRCCTGWFSTIGDDGVVASGGATRLTLVGRRVEFERLTVALDDATDGRMRAVAVLGDPGIGKTRLVEELAGVATSRGLAVAWGRATRQQGAPPYWVWRQVIDSLARADKSPRDPWADSEFLRSGAPDRYAQLEALRDRLDRGAARRGLLIILDDAQWLDESSLWLLTEFVQLRDVDRMLLVWTARLPDMAREQATTPTEVAGGDRFERVVLGPLPSDDIAAQVRGLSDGSELDADTVRAVVDRADGNPFFAAELCRAAAITLAAGRKPAGNLPETVRDAVRQRLHGLSPSSVTALEAASVLGRSFMVGLLADILGARPLHTIEALEEAVGSAVLVRDERLGAYRFAHPLIPEAVVEGLDLEFPATAASSGDGQHRARSCRRARRLGR